MGVSVQRYRHGGVADLCPFDRRQNEVALGDGYRVFSSYNTPAGKVWVITESES